MSQLVEIAITPNPEALKFVLDKPFMKGLEEANFYSKTEAEKYSPLAFELLHFSFIQDVFMCDNFITITKTPLISWNLIQNELCEFINDFLLQEKTIITKLPQKSEKKTSEPFSIFKKQSTAVLKMEKNSLDKPIIDLLEEFIEPAVKKDGGKIEYLGVKNGVVYVKMSGACAGCPGATATLKLGIETLLKKHFSEVEMVKAVN